MEEEPDHGRAEYKIFKRPPETAKSILLSAAVRLSAFILPQITRITSRDDMELGLMGSASRPCSPSSPTTTARLITWWGCSTPAPSGPLLPGRPTHQEPCRPGPPDDGRVLQRLPAGRLWQAPSHHALPQHHVHHCTPKHFALKALFKDDWEGFWATPIRWCIWAEMSRPPQVYLRAAGKVRPGHPHRSSVSRGSHGSSSVSYQQTGRICHNSW